MLDKQLVNGEVEVTFVLDEASHHCPVCVAGDFNGWHVSADPLQPDGEGQLVASVRLPAGRNFQFRYRDALGRWFNDESADDYCANEWGGMNGVVRT
jgi:hypothetical protein